MADVLLRNGFPFMLIIIFIYLGFSPESKNYYPPLAPGELKRMCRKIAEWRISPARA